jgi:hypothetical protein
VITGPHDLFTHQAVEFHPFPGLDDGFGIEGFGFLDCSEEERNSMTANWTPPIERSPTSLKSPEMGSSSTMVTVFWARVGSFLFKPPSDHKYLKFLEIPNFHTPPAPFIFFS